MRILLVTQMWPSERNPDLGELPRAPEAGEIEALGNEVAVAAIEPPWRPPDEVRAAAPRRSVRAGAAASSPTSSSPTFCFPAGMAGAAAARAAGAPLVAMAHGQDVANIGGDARCDPRRPAAWSTDRRP